MLGRQSSLILIRPHQHRLDQFLPQPYQIARLYVLHHPPFVGDLMSFRVVLSNKNTTVGPVVSIEEMQGVEDFLWSIFQRGSRHDNSLAAGNRFDPLTLPLTTKDEFGTLG